MSIRPIDFQVLVPKTQQMSQENQALNNKIRNEQEYLIQQDKINVEQQLNKVKKFENKDRLNMRNDQDKNKKGYRQDLDKKKEDDEKEDEHKNTDKKFMNGIGTNIDIKI
ncbi:hypothetical protein [Marinisporobacter balticus]|uniref:Uncharacterized protein n=1 Tax=Marinisporobacter balticus TaxID=2018667 RepID=A0A4R2LAX3_9FIRM|nr:hypothetical protein [Marinisporobacter balticus]TCO79918.1 hypothetical protein EV214_101152 [Marinisporobacter balticus]